MPEEAKFVRYEQDAKSATHERSCPAAERLTAVRGPRRLGHEVRARGPNLHGRRGVASPTTPVKARASVIG